MAFLGRRLLIFIGAIFIFLLSSSLLNAKVSEGCAEDSIFNYFPQAEVERIWGYKASSLSGEGINYTCNGGKMLFNLDTPLNFYKIEVQVRKERTAAAAAGFYSESTESKVTAGVQQQGLSEKREPLGIGDESIIIGSLAGSEIFKYKGVARSDNFVFTVIADVTPSTIQSLYPDVYKNLNSSKVALKVKELLQIATSKPRVPYNEPQGTPPGGYPTGFPGLPGQGGQNENWLDSLIEFFSYMLKSGVGLLILGFIIAAIIALILLIKKLRGPQAPPPPPQISPPSESPPPPPTPSI